MEHKLFLIFSAILISAASAQAPGSFTATNISAFYNWLPILALAVLAAVGITALYYGAGALLGNARVKATAIGEFWQVLGTLVVLAIILSMLNFFGNAVYQTDSSLTASVQSICSSTQLGASPINFLKSSTSGPTMSICGLISGAGSSGSDITTNIDYGLAATYAIIANLTSQQGVNLNALNVFENYYNTLASFSPVESICWPSIECATPVTPATTYIYANYSYKPFDFYTKIRGGTLLVGNEALIGFYTGILELIGIILLLYAWPYLLAAGLILRASFLTRKAGGLMIAIVLVSLLLFPILNIFEYSSLTCNQQSSTTCNVSPIGANAIPANSVQLYGINPATQSTLCATFSQTCSLTGSGTVISYNTPNINFYVLPRLDYVLNYYGCWPPQGSILLADTIVAGAYSLPGVGQLLALRDFIGSFAGSLPTSPLGCTPENTLNSLMGIANFYGMVFTMGVLIPVLNILMLLSAVRGISSLLGGDTSLLGLSRLL